MSAMAGYLSRRPLVRLQQGGFSALAHAWRSPRWEQYSTSECKKEVNSLKRPLTWWLEAQIRIKFESMAQRVCAGVPAERGKLLCSPLYSVSGADGMEKAAGQ